MNEMLTAKDMQELLQVDRSTIYRMAESGRLPAIKVGKQWRFPADKVDRLFDLKITPANPPSEFEKHEITTGEHSSLNSLLPLECVQLIQDTFADLLGVMLVTTDMDGNPITDISHSCGLFETISQVPHALQRCLESWRGLANTIELEPKFSKSHLGLLCTRAMIRVGPELKGMVIAGCVAPEHWPPSMDEIKAIAEDFEVDADLIEAQIDEVFYLDVSQRQIVLAYMQRIANIIAHIVNERKVLVGRLEAIADLSVI